MSRPLHLLRSHVHGGVESGQILVVGPTLGILRDAHLCGGTLGVGSLEKLRELLDGGVDRVPHHLRNARPRRDDALGIESGHPRLLQPERARLGIRRLRPDEPYGRSEVLARDDDVPLELSTRQILELPDVGRHLLDERHEPLEILRAGHGKPREELPVDPEHIRVRSEGALEPKVAVALDRHLGLPLQRLDCHLLIRG